MKKMFTKIAAGIVSAAMLCGVGFVSAKVAKDNATQVKAAESLTKTFDLSAEVPSDLTASISLAKDSTRGMGVGGKNYTLTSSASFSNVSKVVVSSATNYGTYSNHSISVTVGTVSFGSQNFTDKGTTAYEFVAFGSGTLVVSFNNSAVGTTSKNTIWCSSIEVYTDPSGGTPVVTKYSVTYDSNGATSGAVPTDSGEYESGANVTVLGNTGNLAKTGFTFDGWNTKADGSGTSYVAGNTFSITSNTTLYAKWTEVAITPDYDFSTIMGTGWTGTYAEHVQNYENLSVTFTSANKPSSSSSITDVPVTKGADIIVLALNNKNIKNTEWFFKQWTTKAQTITLNYSTDAGNTYSTLTPSVTSTNFYIPETELPEGTNAIKISFSSADNQIGVCGFNAELVDAPVCTAVSIDKTNSTVEVGHTLTLSATTTPTGYPIAWTADNDNVTISGNVLTGQHKGTVVVTATSGDVSDSFTVTVTDSTNYGTAENPLTIDQAIALIDAKTGDYVREKVTVVGMVSESSYNSTYSNYNVWLKNGNTVNAFELYRLDLGDLDNENYHTENGLVGYTIVATGYASLYKGTYELTNVGDENPIAVSVTKSDVDVEEIIFVNVGDNCKMTTNDSLTIEYYAIPEEHNEALVWASSNESVATVDDSGKVTLVSPGTTTISLTASRSGQSVSTVLTVLRGASYASLYTETLTRNDTTATSTTYVESTASKDYAEYKFNSAGSNESIQLRSTNNSGIVVTESLAYAKKVTIEFNSNTTSGRKIDIYGSETPYSATTDLYDNAKKGTLLGSIVYETSTELTISGNYPYIGIRSNSGAIYITSITIDWEDVYFATVKDVEDISGFVSGYLMMPSYSENNGWCADSEHHYYADAKGAFNSLLTDNQRRLFMEDAQYADARARYETWAAFNGDTTPYASTYGKASPAIKSLMDDASSVTTVVTVTAIASITLVGGLTLSRKRKHF